MISNDDVFGLACTAGALSHIVIGDVHGMLVVVHARCIVREGTKVLTLGAGR